MAPREAVEGEYTAKMKGVGSAPEARTSLGGDFTFAGKAADSAWAAIATGGWHDIEGRLGGSGGGRGDMVVLKLKLSWRGKGLEFRADPMHAEETLRGMGLSMGPPGLDAPGKYPWDEDGCLKDMNPADSKRY